MAPCGQPGLAYVEFQFPLHSKKAPQKAELRGDPKLPGQGLRVDLGQGAAVSLKLGFPLLATLQLSCPPPPSFSHP